MREPHFLYSKFRFSLPAWGAIQPDRQDRQYHLISILVPRVGSDNIESHAFIIIINFNSRSLHGERYQEDNVILFDLKISILVPCVGSDDELLREAKASTISILAPCVGSDDVERTTHNDEYLFNSRSPHRERPYPSGLYPPKRFFNSRSPHGERPIQFCFA